MTEPLETQSNDALEEFASNQAEGNRGTSGHESSGPGDSSESLPSNGNSASNPEKTAVATDNEAETESSGFLPVLTNLNFLALWSGQIFSQLADKVYLVLMIALISSRFQAEGQSISGWVSAIMIAFTIPAILFGSVAGVLVGRVSKKQVLVITNVLRGVLVLAIPFLLGWVGTATAWGDLPLGFYLLLLITFCVSTLTQFFAPAEQSILPLVVEERLLLPANSLYTTTMMAATIIGFAIGDKVLNWAEELLSALFAMDSGKAIAVGVSYVIAAGLLLLMRVHEPADFQGQQGKVWQDIKEGFAYLQEKKDVRSALIELVVLFSVFAALAVLAVRIAEVIPTLETDQFGGLLSSGSIGLGVGALGVGQFGPQIRKLLGHRALRTIGSIGMVASLAGLSVATHELSLAIAAIISFGFFAALVGIPAQTTIQEKTPPAMRGKVFGLQNNAVNIALSLPLALAGIAEQRIGLQATLLGLALFVALGNLSTWYLSRPSETEN